MHRRLLIGLLVLCQAGNAQAQELRVFFGNLHSHTSYSDGSGTPREAYKHARDVARLDFLAITEHNHSKAGGAIARDHSLYNGACSKSLISASRRFTQDGRFVAIYGQEFSTIGSGNHANVFEVQEVIDESTVPSGNWDVLLNTWIPNNLDSGGQPALMLLNHPAIKDSPSNREYGFDDFNSVTTWRMALDSRAELINIINGPSHGGDSPGRPSESEFRRYLDLGFHVAPTADQDNHLTNWGSAANTRTAVIAPMLTKPAIMAAMRARHVYASEDRNLKLIPTIGRHLIGNRVTGASVPAVGTEISIVMNVSDPDEPSASYSVDVFSDEIGGDDEANIVQTAEHQGNGTLTISGVRYEGGDQYVFLRIRQQNDQDDADEGDRVWTAPVWFEPGAAADAPPTMTEAVVPAVSLTVDLVGETARVSNDGTQQLDLTAWTIVSTTGSQRFEFPWGSLLAPGQFLTVVSGARANNLRVGQIAWTTENVWRNAGDPGELRNREGAVVARTP